MTPRIPVDPPISVCLICRQTDGGTHLRSYVGRSRGNQLNKAEADHNAAYRSVEGSDHVVREVRGEKPAEEDGSNGLADGGEEAELHRLPGAAGGDVDGGGHGSPLRDVVAGQREGDRHPSGEALGEVNAPAPVPRQVVSDSRGARGPRVVVPSLPADAGDGLVVDDEALRQVVQGDAHSGYQPSHQQAALASGSLGSDWQGLGGGSRCRGRWRRHHSARG